MPPILIYAEEAERILAALRPALPEERLVAVTEGAALDAALAEHGPEIAFAIKGNTLPPESYAGLLRHPGLAWLHVGGSGYEHLGSLAGVSAAVTNCTGVLAPFLAETTIGAILALNHGLIAYRDRQIARNWQPRAFRPLLGQRLLVVGAGAIGRAVALRASALGLAVTGLNRSGAAVDGIERMRPLSALDDALGEADIVSLHLRLTPETEGIMDAGRFARMRKGALFLNSARGGHVVEPALIEALGSGHLSGAWIDVCRTEPLPEDDPLWTAPNLLLTPHASDGVEDWVERFAALFAENVGNWRSGTPLRNQVHG